MNTDTAITMLLAMGVAAVVSFLSTPMVKSLAYKVGAIDVPKDNRRMHKVPIPRLGGLAIFLAFLLSVLVFANIDRQMQGILLGATMIVVLGVMDDIMALNALPKLIVQILAAGIAVYHGCVIQFVSNPNVFSSMTYLNLGWWSYPITIIWIVAITNAVNLIDGLDGSSGRRVRYLDGLNHGHRAHGRRDECRCRACGALWRVPRLHSLQHEPSKNLHGRYGRNIFGLHSRDAFRDRPLSRCTRSSPLPCRFSFSVCRFLISALPSCAALLRGRTP